ncbi:hypothetical protein THAOC_09666 [Thalassiosira oceanica]|uniref:FHA domain-containing protein n=1 Tax=Thalassiosira oceanica TaxID=159749 RepID=K0T725_THAOC|nr:hypothetical protein THAOC_09666 [Thalassiosira oceanica]|eukprot:EJK69116.1 hypothetical protein THAOC_09666 [Thalassiosira oceanica]
MSARCGCSSSGSTFRIEEMDDDLKIPKDGTLKPPHPSAVVSLGFSLDETSAHSSGCRLDELLSIIAADNTSTTACVSQKFSTRCEARSLIIGRQQSSVDIRIDSKSVSRKHSAIYYSCDGKSVIVQDLGGKHGTYLDNKRIERSGSQCVSLNEAKSCMLRFGNAPLVCEMSIPAMTKAPSSLHAQKVTEGDQAEEIPGEVHDGSALQHHRRMETDMHSSRETREQQIAEMMKSFDMAPVYKKYSTPDDEEIVPEKRKGPPATGRDNRLGDSNGTREDNPHRLPITSSIILSSGSDSFTSSDGADVPLQGNASVSSLEFEPSGTRLLAGHRDGTLRFYDFNGMQPKKNSSGGTTYAPFRIVDSDNDPLDSTGHIISSVGPSATGGSWIVGTTSAQPRVLDREGVATLFHFIKGDTYVTDSSNTKGHTAPVTGVAFNPLIRDVCYSTGLDGSIRQWDVSGRGRSQFNKLICQKLVGKVKNAKGQRTQVVSNLAVHPNGRKIAVGTSCGSVQIWDCSSISNRPLGTVHSAHGNMKPVTFVTFSASGIRIATRSDVDECVRVWDVDGIVKGSKSFSRKVGSRRGDDDDDDDHPSCIAICKGLPALNESSACAFGCDGRRNARKQKKNKNKTERIDPILSVGVAPNASVLGVCWHAKLNQIAIGTSNGIVKVFYDPFLSKKGALIPSSKSVRQSDGLSELLRARAPTGSAAFLGSANDNIITPNSLPLFREEPKATRKTRDLDRKDPEKSRLPEPPVTGGIKTGTSGMGGGVTFSQYIVESTNYVNNKNIAGKDPREELFKYSEGKSYVSKAYEGDVQRILAEKTVEEEIEGDSGSRKRQKTAK